MIFHQRRRRRLFVIRGYEKRIHKLEKRLLEVEGDALLVTKNQLRFLKYNYQDYLSEKGGLI